MLLLFVLGNYIVNYKYKITNIYDNLSAPKSALFDKTSIPAHGRSLQEIVNSVAPEQFFPPYEGLRTIDL